MQRRKTSDRVQRFIYRKVRPEGEALQMHASEWLRSKQNDIETAYQNLDLPFLEDRDCESWEPLFAVLTIADANRLEELRACAEKLTSDKNAHLEDESLSLRLLADVRAVLNGGEQAIFTGDLIERLRGDAEAPWQTEIELNPRKLARFLKPFGVAPMTVRTEQGTGKGYRTGDLEDIFARYLDSKTSHESQSA
jgi:hypothetical protein